MTLAILGATAVIVACFSGALVFVGCVYGLSALAEGMSR